MSAPSHQVRVVSVRREGHLAYVTLEVPADFTFEAGQHLILHTEEGPFYYSISSAPSVLPRVELLIGCKPGDQRTEHLLGQMESGQALGLTGPFGSFHLPENLSDHLLFIGMGTGISPLRAMILQLTEQSYPGNIHLVQGAAETLQLPYHHNFEQLEKGFSAFHYHPVLSREDWQGHNGRVHDIYPDIITENTNVFLCGSQEMVEECEVRLGTLGVKREKVFREKY
ncbi:MAG: hypothetical protein KDD36_14485 [Flavobacteriales bacterium]|nr:hypothetical protein [Flavobacteriales bacterium]